MHPISDLRIRDLFKLLNIKPSPFITFWVKNKFLHSKEIANRYKTYY